MNKKPTKTTIKFNPRDNSEIREVFEHVADDKHLDKIELFKKTKVKNNIPNCNNLIALCDATNSSISFEFHKKESKKPSIAIITYISKDALDKIDEYRFEAMRSKKKEEDKKEKESLTEEKPAIVAPSEPEDEDDPF